MFSVKMHLICTSYMLQLCKRYYTLGAVTRDIFTVVNDRFNYLKKLVLYRCDGNIPSSLSLKMM